MPGFTIVYGLVLIGIGVGFYFGTATKSFTPLIPAAIGLLALIAGVLAMKPRLRKHSMHAAAVLGLLALGGSAPGIMKCFKMMGGAEIERPTAAIAQAIVAVLSILFLAACVNSFIQARRKKTT